VGDVVKVQIARVDLAARHLDLRLAELPRRAEADGETGKPRAQRPPSAPRRGKGKLRGYRQGRRGRRGR
jgi:hypothetical protein